MAKQGKQKTQHNKLRFRSFAFASGSSSCTVGSTTFKLSWTECFKKGIQHYSWTFKNEESDIVNICYKLVKESYPAVRALGRCEVDCAEVLGRNGFLVNSASLFHTFTPFFLPVSLPIRNSHCASVVINTKVCVFSEKSVEYLEKLALHNYHHNRVGAEHFLNS